MPGLADAICHDIWMMFEDWHNDSPLHVPVYYRNVTARTFNKKTGTSTATKDNDVEIDAIVQPYGLHSISMSNGDLIMGDIEVIAVDKDVRLPYGQLRRLPADPATNDQVVYGTLVYQIMSFVRDGTQALWVISARRAGGGA